MKCSHCSVLSRHKWVVIAPANCNTFLDKKKPSNAQLQRERVCVEMNRKGCALNLIQILQLEPLEVSSKRSWAFFLFGAIRVILLRVQFSIIICL